MPYRNGPVPLVYEPAFIKREYERIAEAYDTQDALGGLSLPVSDGPIPQSLTPVFELINAWTEVTPTPFFGDGPVQTDPRIAPASEIEVLQDGLYIVSFYMNYSHLQGAEIAIAFFVNDIQTGLGAVVDASQQSQASSMAFMGMFPFNDGNVLDVRAQTVLSEDVEWVSGAFQVFKLRDLRTRFS